MELKKDQKLSMFMLQTTVEKGMVVAFMGPIDSPEDRIVVSSIAVAALAQNPQLFEEWKKLLAGAARATIESFLHDQGRELDEYHVKDVTMAGGNA